MVPLWLRLRPGQMDDSHKRVNGNVDVPQKTSVPSRYHQYMTSEDEAQSSSAQSSEEEEEEEEEITAKSISSVLPHVKSEVPAKEISQVLLERKVCIFFRDEQYSLWGEVFLGFVVNDQSNLIFILSFATVKLSEVLQWSDI